MQSGTNGFFTMLLTAVPLLAVPALAIFGIPQFAPMSASPHAEDEEKDLLTDEGEGDSSEELLNDLDPRSTDKTRSDGPGRRKSRSSRGSKLRQESGADDYSHSHREDRHDIEEISSGENSSISRSGSSKSISELALDSEYIADENAVSDTAIDNRDDEQSPADRLTWKSAVRELKRLGITDFRLEPGSAPESFLFCCMLSSADKPRVVRRFEAEAEDPLAAVADVIGQVRDHTRAPLGN
ncbi:MAG: hypothetical protein ACKVT0_21440 [Planctomycetaceae bacterium]